MKNGKSKKTKTNILSKICKNTEGPLRTLCQRDCDERSTGLELFAPNYNVCTQIALISYGVVNNPSGKQKHTLILQEVPRVSSSSATKSLDPGRSSHVMLRGPRKECLGS